MSTPAEITLVLVVILSEKWSIWIALAYLLLLHLMSANDQLKRRFLSSNLFKFCPHLKSLTLKLINSEYNEIKDNFGKPFYCKCQDKSEVPRAHPTTSDQGQTESCSLQAISKCIVSLLDKKHIDANQEDIVDVLVTHIGSAGRQWPSVVHRNTISIQGTNKAEDPGRIMKLKIKLFVKQVTCLIIIPDDTCEYVLCTSFLSPNDLHTVYVEKRDEQTARLTCINSWGHLNEPHPIILDGHSSNIFFKIEMEIESNPDECKNCIFERRISEAYASALKNDLFQSRKSKLLTLFIN